VLPAIFSCFKMDLNEFEYELDILTIICGTATWNKIIFFVPYIIKLDYHIITLCLLCCMYVLFLWLVPCVLMFHNVFICNWNLRLLLVFTMQCDGKVFFRTHCIFLYSQQSLNKVILYILSFSVS
jgi:hypothetical protein